MEAASGLLRRMSQAVVDILQLSTGEEAPELLKVLTEPLTRIIIQVPHQHQHVALSALKNIREHLMIIHLLISKLFYLLWCKLN